jgi:hypothetical protein
MLLPTQLPPINREVGTTKLLKQQIVLALAEKMIIAKNTHLQCQLCCLSNGGDACRHIPNCACPILDSVA